MKVMRGGFFTSMKTNGTDCTTTNEEGVFPGVLHFRSNTITE